MEELSDSIWRFSSATPGTSLVVSGGMHGNESTGIEVVRHYVEGFKNGTYTLAAGTLTLVLGNTRAIARNERWIEGRDMNRYFSDAHLVDHIDPSWEEDRATAIAAIFKEAEVLIDIHSTNKPSSPFACSRIDPAHSRLYRWFFIDNVIEDPDYVFGDGPVTADEYMDRIGNTGICIEAGKADGLEHLERTIQSVRGVMTELGLLAEAPPALPENPPATWRFYNTIKLGSEGFSFAEGMGTHSFQPLQAGEVLGYAGKEPVTIDRDGVIIFPKLPEHQQLGKPVCYIAIAV